MNARQLIYDHFLRQFENKRSYHIGSEHEFPLINRALCDVDKDAARGAMEHFLSHGFTVEASDDEENPAFIVNSDGDVLSFDNSYNNFEFSLAHAASVTELADRFYPLFDAAQSYFNKYDHELVGRGSNPNKEYISTNPVHFPVYNMVREFLSRGGKHGYNDFPAYISSVQTHLDMPLSDLPFCFTLFGRLDFARCLLFANSPDFEGKGYVCARDMLWEGSAFGSAKNITGAINGEFKSTDDLLDNFAKKDLFNRVRNGKYETFDPVNIIEYFENPAFGSTERDIDNYLSFCNVEITARGTLEIRSDCEQPPERTFFPVAFNTGIYHARESAAKILDDFFKKEKISLPNSELRRLACEGKEICDKAALDALTSDLKTASHDALCRRGFYEEKFIV